MPTLKPDEWQEPIDWQPDTPTNGEWLAMLGIPALMVLGTLDKCPKRGMLE